MRQKYHIARDDAKNELLIQEYAVVNQEFRRKDFPSLSEETFSLLCEQVYDAKTVESSITKGKQSLISLLRNHNWFPIAVYIDRIADSVIELFASEDPRPAELIFDDKDFFTIGQESADIAEEIEATPETASEEIDELLDDDDGAELDADATTVPFAENGL
jgi:hypothetical protein